jgi:enoyl-CoA hydratase
MWERQTRVYWTAHWPVQHFLTKYKSAQILRSVTKEIVFDVNERIGVLTVNRPESRNALNWAAQEQFAYLVRNCRENLSLRALIITGTGEKAFVAGGDLKELLAHKEPDTGERLQRTMSKALQELTQLPFPVIAAVNGDAIGGGCEILTACDLRIAAAHARFQFPQVRLGLTTGWGGTGRLVRLIGQSRASEWLLTGRTIDAYEAERAGFINRVSSPEMNIMQLSMDLALALTQFPGEPLVATKSLISSAANLPLAEVYEAEKKLFTKMWLTEERLEAVRTIVEKREPLIDPSAEKRAGIRDV